MKNFHLFVAVRPQGPCSKLCDEVQRDYNSSSVDAHDPEDWQNLIAQLSQLQPDVLLLELEPIVDRLEQALQEVRGFCSRIKVVLVTPNLDSQQILRSIRAGADEFVHPPWEQGLSVALHRLAAAVDSKKRTAKAAKSSHFFPPRAVVARPLWLVMWQRISTGGPANRYCWPIWT